MNNSRKRFEPTLRKPIFGLIAIAVSILFLVQCTGSSGEYFGFEEELKEHFADMSYAKVLLATDPSSRRNKADIDYQKGSGSVVSAEGNELNYKWAYLIDENGDLLGGYLGTSEMTSITNVELTSDQARDGLRRCAAIDQVSERHACLDRVVNAIFSDCEASLSLDSCHEQCWLTPNKCDAPPL